MDTTDRDQEETREWLDSLEFVLNSDGVERANFLLERLSARMTKTGARLPYTITTPYRNTIPSSQEAFMPGDLFMERRIRSLIRWNALAMVVRTNRREGDLGGHISSFASSTLYECFNYFFPRRLAQTAKARAAGDLVSFRALASIYRAVRLGGPLSEAQLRRVSAGSRGKGLPAPPLADADYWQFPTRRDGVGRCRHSIKAIDGSTGAEGWLPMGNRKVWESAPQSFFEL